MKNEKLQEQLVELRIRLQNICDGFNVKDLNKQSTLTMRVKVLFLLSKNEKCSPNLFINTLAIAKSNLALLCKSMCDDKVIEQVKGEEDKRSVYYSITQAGKDELSSFYQLMGNNATQDLNAKECKTLEKKISDILEYINKKI